MRVGSEKVARIVNVRYALAVFFDAFDWGFPEAVFFAAQKAFILSACCLR